MSEVKDVVARVQQRAEASRKSYSRIFLWMFVSAALVVVVFAFGATLSNIDKSDASSALWAHALGRIGAVVVAIYVLQLMYSFARYHARMASHLEATADVLELAADDFSNLELLQRCLLPTSVDFGKSPTSPLERALDLADELAKRSASSKS